MTPSRLRSVCDVIGLMDEVIFSGRMCGMRQTEGSLQHRDMDWNMYEPEQSEQYRKPAVFFTSISIGALNPSVNAFEKGMPSIMHRHSFTHDGLDFRSTFGLNFVSLDFSLHLNCAMDGDVIDFDEKRRIASSELRKTVFFVVIN